MKNKAIKSIIKTVPLFSLAMLFSSCDSDNKKQIENPNTKVQNVKGPETVPVKFFNPSYTISVPAELKPYNEVAVYSKIQGFIKKLYVDRGDKVKKGQLLAVLEAPEIEQQYLSDKSIENKMQSEYLFSKQAYERMKEASQTDGAVAPIELERAKNVMLGAASSYESSQAGSEKSSQIGDYLHITAPFSGVINERFLSVGSLVGTGKDTPIFYMAESGILRLTVSLPEKHAASIKTGMEATFTVTSRPGKVFNAKLSRTSGTLNQNDRSLTLEFDIDNENEQLQGGDYAQVQLNLKRNSPTYWVPNQSVLDVPSGTFVMTYNKSEKTINRLPIREGIQNDSLTEVFGALSKDDLIIKKPSEEMKTGKLTE
jgi:RND family efflux transporter MFP subunit